MSIDNSMEDKLENLEDKPNWGGKRPNSGRPLGSMNKSTREQKEVENYYKDRVKDSIESLVNSQMNLAKGIQMLFKIHTNSKGERSKPELVTSQSEIEEYLAGDYDDSEDYYFITTKAPDNKALDSLLDRTIGKASQKIEHSGQILNSLTPEQQDKLDKILIDDKQEGIIGDD